MLQLFTVVKGTNRQEKRERCQVHCGTRTFQYLWHITVTNRRGVSAQLAKAKNGILNSNDVLNGESNLPAQYPSTTNRATSRADGLAGTRDRGPAIAS